MIFFLSILSFNIFAQPLSVEIFTISTMPVIVPTGMKVDYYNVDEAGRLLQLANSTNASLWFMQNQALLQHAFYGINLASDYGIKAIPAIVINKEAIVEGNTNVSSAILEYESWHVH
jgi:hypothetical protein